MCRELEIKDVHFIQPCPAIGKQLTEDERKVVRNLDYADSYQHMESALLLLSHQDISVVSLLNCFETTKETVYADTVHCDRQGPGYKIMAERMASDVARLWGVKRN